MDTTRNAEGRLFNLGILFVESGAYLGGHKEDSMGKVIMYLLLPEPKVRKHAVKAMRTHKDKTKYTRKAKHWATTSGGLNFWGA